MSTTQKCYRLFQCNLYTTVGQRVNNRCRKNKIDYLVQKVYSETVYTNKKKTKHACQSKSLRNTNIAQDITMLRCPAQAPCVAPGFGRGMRDLGITLWRTRRGALHHDLWSLPFTADVVLLTAISAACTAICCILFSTKF